MQGYDSQKLLCLALEGRRLAGTAGTGRTAFVQENKDGALCAAAIREGLGGLFYRRLKIGDNWDSASNGLAEPLKQVYYSGIQKNLRLLGALSEILAEVHSARVKVVMLQGISLLDDVYADIGLRALTDIDLWVLPADFAGFEACMQRLGYFPRSQYPQTFIRGETIVDVHTHLLWADRIKSRDSLLRIDQQAIFNCAERLKVDGQTAHRLARVDQFIYLCLHVLKHSFQRLIWLADIVYLAGGWNSADWRSLRERAGQLGQHRTVQYILFMLETLADFRLPGDCGELFASPPLKSWEKAVLRLRCKRDRLPLWAPLVLLPADLDSAAKARFIFENLFPEPPVLRQVFSSSPHLANWQLYGLRVLQLLGLKKHD